MADEDQWKDLPGVCVQQVTGRGRGLFAARDFQAGEVVLRCRPFVHLLQRSLADTRCSECYRLPDSDSKLLRCTMCKFAHYCGKQCQKQAWRAGGHRGECAALAAGASAVPSECWDEVMLACRVVRAARHDPAAARQALGMYTPSNKTFLLSFEPVAQCLLAVLGPDAAPWTLPSACALMASLQCNNFAVHDDLLFPRGSAVFPAGALLNHNCDGNCVITYEEGTHEQVFRCLRAISAGDELCHSYLDQVHTTKMRQERLLGLYDFQCSCRRCSGSDPHWVGLEACLQLFYPTSLDMTRRAAGERLPSLGEDGLSADNLQTLQRARAAVSAGSSQLNKPADDVASLLPPFEKLATFCHPAHLDLLSVACQLQNVALLVEDFGLALRAAQHVARAYEAVYPEMHPMNGLQLLRVADTADLLGLETVATTARQRAQLILRCAFGDQNSTFSLTA